MHENSVTRFAAGYTVFFLCVDLFERLRCAVYPGDWLLFCVMTSILPFIPLAESGDARPFSACSHHIFSDHSDRFRDDILCP